MGQSRLGIIQQRLRLGHDVARAHGDSESELSQQPPNGVDAGGAGGKPRRAQAVKGADELLGD